MWKSVLDFDRGSLTRLHLLSHSRQLQAVLCLRCLAVRDGPARSVSVSVVAPEESLRLCPGPQLKIWRWGEAINGSLWLWLRAVQLNLNFVFCILISFQFFFKIFFKDCSSPLLLTGRIIKLKIHKITAEGHLRTSKGCLRSYLVDLGELPVFR